MDKTWLCYWELHVDDQTFRVHVLVKAGSPDEAVDRLHGMRGEHYHLQAKGCLGEFSEALAGEYLAVGKDGLPS